MKQKLIDQDIFEELGLEHLPDKEKFEILKTFSQTVMQAVIMRATVEMSDKQNDEFSKLLDEGDEEKIGNFMKNNIKNLEELIDLESLKFKKLLIEKVKQTEKRLYEE